MDKKEKTIAVIDTETNYYDELISVGIVVADRKTYQKVSQFYVIINPAYLEPSLYGNVLYDEELEPISVLEKDETMEAADAFLLENNVDQIYAYNAAYDYRHLKELQKYTWLDILKVASYRQYNPYLPQDDSLYCRTGKLKANGGVEKIYPLLSQNYGYYEVHNALKDAEDELSIMEMLGLPIEVYENANRDFLAKQGIIKTKE